VDFLSLESVYFLSRFAEILAVEGTLGIVADRSNGGTCSVLLAAGYVDDREGGSGGRASPGA
jgi:hypothetical protein